MPRSNTTFLPSGFSSRRSEIDTIPLPNLLMCKNMIPHNRAANASFVLSGASASIKPMPTILDKFGAHLPAGIVLHENGRRRADVVTGACVQVTRCAPREQSPHQKLRTYRIQLSVVPRRINYVQRNSHAGIFLSGNLIDVVASG